MLSINRFCTGNIGRAGLPGDRSGGGRGANSRGPLPTTNVMTWTLPALVGAIAFAAYLPLLIQPAEFVFDDRRGILANPDLRPEALS